MKKVWDKWTRIALVKRILVGLILGAILGIAVPQATGIAILGDVFVSALKAIAPLLVFFLVVSSLCNAGKSHGGVIKTVIILYMFSTVLAAVIAVFASMAFPVKMTLANAATDTSAPQGIVEVLNNLLLNVVANPVSSLVNANYVGILMWGFSYYPNFRFQLHAELAENGFTNGFDQADHVAAGGVAGVYDKAGVLVADARAADLIALHAAVLNEPAGKESGRSLENAAGAGHVERLFFSAQTGILIHLGRDFSAVALGQGQHGFDNNEVSIAEYAFAVAELMFLPLHGFKPPLVVDIFGLGDDVVHVPVVRARVHVHRAADGAGYAVGELKPGERVVAGEICSLSDGRAGPGLNGVRTGDGNAAQTVGHNDKAAHALVAHEDIRAVADHGQRRVRRFADTGQIADFTPARGVGDDVCHAADLEGGVPLHGLVDKVENAVISEVVNNISEVNHRNVPP